jgi:hypothetical protein
VAAAYSANISDEAATNALWATADITCEWIHSKLRVDTASHEHRRIVDNNNLPSYLDWIDLDSWEEMIWCPVLGIKGQIDLILKARALNLYFDDSNKEVFVPIELKTGKWRPNGLIAHRAQVKFLKYLNLCVYVCLPQTDAT